MRESYYDTAQVCLNGHVTNSMAQTLQTSNQNHCDECGEKTIMACPECSTPIRGEYQVPGVVAITHYSAPAFCHSCGTSFPWTQRKLDAAKELADEFEELTKKEREKLKGSLDDLISDTPKTQVAEARFKRLMKKAGREAYDGMKSILVDVVSEAVKKSVFGIYKPNKKFHGTSPLRGAARELRRKA